MKQGWEYPKKGKLKKEGSNNNGNEKNHTKHNLLAHCKGGHPLRDKKDKKKKIYRFSLYACISSVTSPG